MQLGYVSKKLVCPGDVPPDLIEKMGTLVPPEVPPDFEEISEEAWTLTRTCVSWLARACTERHRAATSAAPNGSIRLQHRRATSPKRLTIRKEWHAGRDSNPRPSGSKPERRVRRTK